MDPVDVLTFSVSAAQLIRSTREAEEALTRAYAELGLDQPPDRDDPMEIRVVRLAYHAGERRPALMDFLRSIAGPLPMNRSIPEDDSQMMEPDPEAVRLQEAVEENEENGRRMTDDFPSFSVAERKPSGFFGGRTIIIRDGKRLTTEEAGEIRGGDAFTSETAGLPQTVRGLIDYPLEVPVLFTIEVGEEPWSLWDICCAFADQYARIYEEPGKHGVWGHDITDLWIEGLYYYPDLQLIYPHVGS